MALSAPLFTVTASAAAAAVSIAVPASLVGFPQGTDCKAHSRGQRQQRDAASGQLVHHFPPPLRPHGRHGGQTAGPALIALAKQQVKDARQQDRRRNGAGAERRLAGEQAADLKYNQGHRVAQRRVKVMKL